MTAVRTSEDRREPMRRCIVSGSVRPQSALLRFAVSDDGIVAPDLSGRLPGRGIWVEAAEASLRRACDRNMFTRAARRSVRPVDGLVDLVGDQLRQRCLDLLRMGRRADQVVLGHDQVAAAIARGLFRARGPAVLATAADAAPRAVNQAARLAAAGTEVERIGCLTADELGEPFDRERVVHLLVVPGRLAERFLQEASRLAGMRPVETQEVGSG